MDYINLAMTYGGFTSLDRVYLEGKLASLSPQEKLDMITPPPSIINAYFAELYQKQGPKAATDYYFELSKALHFFDSKPSFLERKPFVRLNLSGKAFGFAYQNDQEIAIIFSEKKEAHTASLCLEVAQIFPHYLVYQEDHQLKMSPIVFDQEVVEDLTPPTALLSHVNRLKGGILQITSFNQEEAISLSEQFKGQRYYQFHQRQSIIYIKE